MHLKLYVFGSVCIWNCMYLEVYVFCAMYNYVTVYILFCMYLVRYVFGGVCI